MGFDIFSTRIKMAEGNKDYNILVYGTGFTGTGIIKLLVEKGYKPVIAARVSFPPVFFVFI